MSQLTVKINQRSYNVQKYVIPFTILCTALLVLLRDVGDISVPRIVIIGLATMACLMCDKAGIYCLMAFLTPLAAGISATYITAIALVILLLKEKRISVSISGLVCLFAILLMELMSGFRGRFDIIEYLRFVGILIFSFLFMLDQKNDYDYDRMIGNFLIGFWTAILCILGQMLNRYSLIQIIGLGVRFGDTRELLDITEEGIRISYDPNGLGALCLLAGLLSLLMHRKTKEKRYMLSFVLATLFGVMTQSRSFIVVFLVSMILYVFLSSNSIKMGLKRIFPVAAGGAAMLLLAMWLIPDYLEALVFRFQVSDISNGRGDITAFYFREMFLHLDRFIFGVGLQNYDDKYGYEMSAHNATQEVLIAWGIFGLVAVVILFVVVFGNGRRRNACVKPVQYLPLAMCLLYLQAGQGFLDKASMLRMMVAFSALVVNMDGKERTDKTPPQEAGGTKTVRLTANEQ